MARRPAGGHIGGKGGGAGARHEAVLVDIGRSVLIPCALRHIGEGQLHRLVAVGVDDDGIVGGVGEGEAGRTVSGNLAGGLELQRPGAGIVVIEIGPVPGVGLTQGGAQNHREPQFPIVLEGELDGVHRSGDGVDHADGDGAGIQAHAQIQVGQVGVLRDVLTVDRPAHAAGQADLQGHIPARQRLEHLFVQLGLAGAEGDLNGAAFLGAFNLVRGLLAGGLGGGAGATAATAAAAPYRPVGVEHGVPGKDGVDGHSLSVYGPGVPAREVIAAAGPASRLWWWRWLCLRCRRWRQRSQCTPAPPVSANGHRWWCPS